ncbi:MAG: glucan biosynthesis protein [Pseudobdellovibrionaceae bacterium]
MKKNLIFGFLTVLTVAIACSSQSKKTERSPSSAGLEDEIQMDLNQMKAEAFSRCQGSYRPPVTEKIPILDPPADGGPEAEGMVFQEELSVRTSNFLDRDGFYVQPRPRAAVNSIPMDIFVESDQPGVYERKTWEDANPDYSNGTIVPPIQRSQIPPAGRVLTEVIIGHKAPDGGYPQLFDLRSSGYVRFAGYPPQITGASMRVATHRIFSLGATSTEKAPEDFPVIRALFLKIKNTKTVHAFALVESDLFCGALSLDMNEGKDADLVVDSYWYTRRDFVWKKDPHTGLIAYSSMQFKTEKHTPNRISDEAHDSDVMVVTHGDGKTKRYLLDPPPKGLKVQDLTEKDGGVSPKEWILANEDRNPSHYADFKPALGNTNYDLRASYKVTILESNVKTGVSLYQHSPDGEYGDNIVAVSTLRQDFRKATSVDQAVHFKYRTTAFFPTWPVR